MGNGIQVSKKVTWYHLPSSEDTVEKKMSMAQDVEYRLGVPRWHKPSIRKSQTVLVIKEMQIPHNEIPPHVH